MYCSIFVYMQIYKSKSIFIQLVADKEVFAVVLF